MAAPNESPGTLAGRRARLLFGAILLAVCVSGLVCFELVRTGSIGAGVGLGLFAVANLALSIALLGRLVRAVEGEEQRRAAAEADRRGLMASLKNEVTAQARELESATANLRVATKVNALLALCAQHMPSGLVITDGGGQVLWANQAWEKLSGLAQADTVRQPVDALLERLWIGPAAGQVGGILRAGKPAAIEMHSGADNRTQWLTIAFQPVHNAEQAVVNFIVIIDDATADRQMRDTLRVAEERLKLALLAADESVWDWDIPTGRIYRDPRWAELIGFNPGELLPDIAEWTSRVHPDDLPGAQAALDATLQNRVSLYVAEYRLRNRAGNWIWTLDRGRVVSRDAEGRPLRMVGTQSDITTRKKLEGRLRHSEEISIQVGRLAQIGAWELLPESSELHWEPELFRIAEVELGYAPSLPKMAEFFPGEHREIFTQSVGLAIREGRAFELECPLVTALGRQRWVHVFGQTESREGRTERLFGAVQDITSRHEAEEMQRRMESQVFQVQKMETLGTMAGGIAHDFNNLLTGIIGFQDLALDGLPEDHSARKGLAEARGACQRACELVEQILVFSRQSGSSERVPVDLAAVIEEARRFLRATVPATIQIEVTVDPRCGRVLADATQINQVLLNLGSNAAHAMRNTGGLLGISLAQFDLDDTQTAVHGNLPSGAYVRLSVADTGHGMSEETQRRIFDPFFTTKDVGEGTGLGLAIVHGIVRSHNGAVEVESAPGAGTTIHVYLPVAAGEDAGDKAPAAQPARGNGEMICIVDDEQIVGQATRLALERIGYCTTFFNAPDECLAALRQRPGSCALVLSDQTMPGMTGMELSAEVRKFAPELPIVIMSGYFSKVSPGALEQIGRIALLAKPFTATELAAVVQRALHPD